MSIRDYVLVSAAAKDGISLNAIVESDSYKTLFNLAKLELPQSMSTLSSLIVDNAKKLKAVVKKHICELAEKKTVFSIAIDEWSSISNERYMNVTLTYNDGAINLGLQRLLGSLTAQALNEFMWQKLNEFGIRTEWILGLTTDGAATMKVLQKNFVGQSQLCLAHAIHLAVQETLTNLKSNDEDMSDEDDDDFEFLKSNCAEAVKKFRLIVNSFEHSPDMIARLKEYQTRTVPLKTVTFVKTRWNSLVKSISRFLELKNEISKVIVDVNAKRSKVFLNSFILYFSPNDFLISLKFFYFFIFVFLTLDYTF